MKTTNGLFQNCQNLNLIWNEIVSITSDSTEVTRSFNLTVTFSPTDIVSIDGYASLTLERATVNDKWYIARWNDESNF